MSLTAEITALGRVHCRAWRARLLQTMRTSRLMSATIGVFLAAYLVAGYWLFSRGLEYITGLPGVGFLLTERMLYMAYFFFFAMLVFSNAVLLYSAVFRGKETAWLLTTPVSPRAVFCWKVIESFAVSSWGLAVLSAPLLASVGQLYGAGPGFFLKCLALYVPFLVLPAIVAALLVLALVRWWGPVLRVFFVVLGALALWKILTGWLSVPDFGRPETAADLNIAFRRVMGSTELTMNRFLPSAWMAEMIIHWASDYDKTRGLFFALLLVGSWALAGGWVCVVVASPATYTAWNLSQQRKARKTGRRRQGSSEAIARSFAGGWTRLVPFVRRDTLAMVRKDLKEFVRDPAQWIPCAVVFTLLLVYAANLNRAMEADPRRPFFKLVLSSLNFGVCCLTLSTLTTRFIFPMFSLEGRRLWILGLSPVSMVRVFRQKLLFFAGLIGFFTCGLMTVSGIKLGMDGGQIAWYCGGIALMSLGLTSLALGLGVLFPNFNDPSPAKIVSGFGGTLCLILNFVYILLFLAMFVWPGAYAESHAGPQWAGQRRNIQVVAGTGLVLLTALFAGVPAYYSARRMKRVELLGRI